MPVTHIVMRPGCYEVRYLEIASREDGVTTDYVVAGWDDLIEIQEQLDTGGAGAAGARLDNLARQW